MLTSWKAPQGMTLGEIAKPWSDIWKGKTYAGTGGQRLARHITRGGSYQVTIYWYRRPHIPIWRKGQWMQCPPGDGRRFIFRTVPFGGSKVITFNCLGEITATRFSAQGITPLEGEVLPWGMLNQDRAQLRRAVYQGLAAVVAPKEAPAFHRDIFDLEVTHETSNPELSGC